MNLALDRRVTLQSLTTSQGLAGEKRESWADVADVWAQRKDVRGREFFQSRKFNGQATSIWMIRYRSDVDILDRLVAGGLYYNILHVKQLDRGRFLSLMSRADTPAHAQALLNQATGEVLVSQDGERILFG